MVGTSTEDQLHRRLDDGNGMVSPLWHIAHCAVLLQARHNYIVPYYYRHAQSLIALAADCCCVALLANVVWRKGFPFHHDETTRCC